MINQFRKIWAKLSTRKQHINAINASLRLIVEAVWGDIWKCTLEKSETNATSAIMLPLNQAIWGHIWKDTIEKNCITIYDILLSISIYLSCLVWLTDYPTREVLEITWKKYDKIMMFRICTKSNYYLSCWWRWRWWVGKTSLTDWLC